MVTKILGEGSTYKVGNRWKAQIRYIDETGRKRSKIFSSKTCKVCREKADAFIARERDGVSTHNEDTVTQYVSYYIETIVCLDNRGSTILRCRQTLDNQITPNIGDMLMRNVKTENIQDLITTLRNKNYSFSTIKKTINLFNAAHRYYVGLGGKTHYSETLIRMPKPDNEEVIFFTEEELAILEKYLFSIISQTRYAAALIILANTGLRVGELLGLSKENINLEAREMYICESASQKNINSDGTSNWSISNQETKTKAGKRTVPLNSKTISAIEYILERDKDINTTYLVCSQRGTQVYQKELSKLFHAVLTETSLDKEKRCGVHSLRHSFATKLVNNNVSIETVSYILGHSNDVITKKYYLHDKETRAKREIARSTIFD